MRRWLAGGAAVLVLASAAFVAFVYQPLVLGSTGGHDEHLLIDVQSSDNGSPTTQYRYEFHAETSYYTVFSLRNQGFVAVTVLGLDPNGGHAMVPSIGPVELRYASTKGDPFTVVDWGSAQPFRETVVEPNAELTLWIRWRIGPCQPPGVPSYDANSGVAIDSIPLRWSILGIPRSTTFSLGYTVAFEVTPAGYVTECQPG